MALRSSAFFGGSERSSASRPVVDGLEDRVQVAVEQPRAGHQGRDLLLLGHLPVDELLDVRVVEVEDDHLAARLVVPPDLIAPAARSPILRNLISPRDFRRPTAARPRRAGRRNSIPVPEPYLKMRASRTHRSMMPPSFTRSS